MAISLVDATAAVAAWTAADLAVAKGQSYSIGSRTLTRANAEEITKKLNYWTGVEAQLQRSAAGETRVGVSQAKFI